MVKWKCEALVGELLVPWGTREYVGRRKVHEDAIKFDQLTYLDVIQRELKVMDSTATSLCMDNKIPIKVFKLTTENILRAVYGENIGTTVE